MHLFTVLAITFALTQVVVDRCGFFPGWCRYWLSEKQYFWDRYSFAVKMKLHRTFRTTSEIIINKSKLLKYCSWGKLSGTLLRLSPTLDVLSSTFIYYIKTRVTLQIQRLWAINCDVLPIRCWCDRDTVSENVASQPKYHFFFLAHYYILLAKIHLIIKKIPDTDTLEKAEYWPQYLI